MNIKATTKFLKEPALVFILKENQNIESHSFFRELAEKDRNHLKLFFKKVSSEGDYSYLIPLPNGGLVLLLGVAGGFSHRKSIIAMRRLIAAVRKERVKKILVNLKDFEAPQQNFNYETLAEITATQFELADFEFVRYKKEPKSGWSTVQEVNVFSRYNPRILNSVLERGQIIGEEINQARILSNTPGGDMTPARLAEAAAKAGKRAGFKVKVLGEKEIKKLKMGGILGVSRGSAEKPRFIIMELLRGKSKEKPVVLVGKGVTFDSGGLNIKPFQGMWEMHLDMTGGAAVIHIMAALARLKVKKNIIGLVPAVENMPSGSSFHPGDLLRSMSGKTIEVLSTDAEGRIIMADGLTYAQKYGPKLIIDIATLTGAAVVALGQRASAVFSNNGEILNDLKSAGEVSGDYVWPLPLWEEYEEEIKGTFGDFANASIKSHYGDAILGAVFLRHFIKDPKTGLENVSWVHLDIAPRMTTIDGEYLAKGSAGPSVALLVQFLRNYF